MPEYTPDTEAIIKVYSAAPIVTEANRLGGRDIARNRAAFHRWLAAHDAVVRADQAEVIENWLRHRGHNEAANELEDLNDDIRRAVVLTPTTKEPSDG